MQKYYIDNSSKIIIIFNKNLLKDNTSMFSRRSDIYIQDTAVNKSYIIDIVIVSDNRLMTMYINKINKYKPLQDSKIKKN